MKRRCVEFIFDLKTTIIAIVCVCVCVGVAAAADGCGNSERKERRNWVEKHLNAVHHQNKPIQIQIERNETITTCEFEMESNKTRIAPRICAQLTFS